MGVRIPDLLSDRIGSDRQSAVGGRAALIQNGHSAAAGGDYGTEHALVPQRLSLTALLVSNYDEAGAFYVGTLGFELREDMLLAAEKRWVVVTPRGAANGLLLARAVGERQYWAIGDQSGGRVFLF